MKNSSRLLAKIARKFARSSSGVFGSSASSSTRSLNASQLRSRSRNLPCGSSVPLSSYGSRSASMSGSRSDTVEGETACGRCAAMDPTEGCACWVSAGALACVSAWILDWLI